MLLRGAWEAEVAFFYGQELNRTTYKLCRMDLILFDVPSHKLDIRLEDILERPQHSNMRFESEESIDLD